MIKKYLDCTTCPQALKFIHHLARLYPWCSLQGNVPYCCPPEMLTSRRILQKTGFLYFLQRGQQREMSPKSNAQRCGMPCDLRLNPSRKFPTYRSNKEIQIRSRVRSGASPSRALVVYRRVASRHAAAPSPRLSHIKPIHVTTHIPPLSPLIIHGPY